MEQSTADQTNSLEMAADIVAAYVGNNSVRTDELPGLISSVYSALSGLGAPAPEPEAAKSVAAVSIKKSVTPDHLISLEDGKRYKTLRRHLTGRGLTPEQYRTKWGLPRDYPMVAANYAKQRSEMARSIGLGRKRTAEPAPEMAAPEPKKRGRKKAA